ncbi:MAG: hypothetical protein MUF75_04980 [Bacteroidia bacterium]|nr:hypothetical protein [Bacteroidia bacterium]
MKVYYLGASFAGRKTHGSRLRIGQPQATFPAFPACPSAVQAGGQAARGSGSSASGPDKFRILYIL